MKDKTKYQEASRKRMANMSPEQMKEKMSNMAKAKWSKTTVEERSAHGKLMAKGRYF